MIRLAMMLTWLCAVSAAPALAQDRMPRAYPVSTAMRVDPERVPPAVRAQDEAAARAAEAGCEAGKSDDCARLGKAYMTGAGKPQNRPAAEVLLREACEKGAAEGCLTLGRLLRGREKILQPHELDAERAAILAIFRRGCGLGALDACEEEAIALTSGDRTTQDDYAAAEALRRETCAKGGLASCRELAIRDFRVIGAPERQEQAWLTLEDLCLRGDAESCSRVIDGADERAPATPLAELRKSGCEAGIAQHCSALAKAAFAQGSGPPEARSAALALFDRACDLDTSACGPGKAIRARPEHAARCAAGSQDDCVALGELYADEGSLLYSPAEAIALLGAACEAGAQVACGSAAQQLLNRAERDGQGGGSQAEDWLLAGCEGGNDADCNWLASRLMRAERSLEDQARGGALLALTCERGDTLSCDELAERTRDDPAFALPLADQRFFAPDEAAVAERFRRKEEERRIEREAWRKSICTTSIVTLRGVTYEDQLCLPVQRVIKGEVLRAGEAPWQALLWRPERVGGRRIGWNDRIACGGALIREGWMLTAAHCVVDPAGRPLTGSGHRIRLGLHSAKENEGFSHPIRETFPHPSYHAPSRAFDIALVRFDPRAGSKGQTTYPIARIRLDPQPVGRRQIRSGMPVYIYGWGQTEFRGATSDLLKGARLELEDPAICERNNRFDVEPLKGALLCAAAADLAQACNGDSGGPLITYADADEVPTVIGVVSAGTDCGQTGVATRYTRVAKVRSWIDDVLAGRSSRTAR